jgi:hypothetical protein
MTFHIYIYILGIIIIPTDELHHFSEGLVVFPPTSDMGIKTYEIPFVFCGG